VPEQFRELEHAAFMADLGGGHQCARELAILSGQIDLADVLVELDQLEVVGRLHDLGLVSLEESSSSSAPT
jgi:hypothetical protein